MSLLLNSHYAAATSRSELLSEFIISNQVPSGGFKDTTNGSIESVNTQTTFANVFVLDKLAKLEDINGQNARSWTFDELDKALQAGDLKNAYYAFSALQLLKGTINDTDDKETFAGYVNAKSSGFGYTSSSTVNILDTYYAIKILTMLGKAEAAYGYDKDDINTYITGLWNTTLKAFVNTNGNSVSLTDNYYALRILNQTGGISQLTSTQKTQLSAMCEEKYTNDVNDGLNYGGYSDSDKVQDTTLLTTYLCVGIQSIVSSEIPHIEETTQWVLDQQSSYDYGFIERNDAASFTVSSAILSYYAVSTLLMLNPEAIEELLSDETWDLSVNGWIVAAIVIGVVGGLVIIGFLYHKKQKII